ncbi:MAG: adenosine deaminase family protein [Deltaproteobacteria bacterium]|nr:adenosine deaminase family protein [Deltaproteobacteria bacterium]
MKENLTPEFIKQIPKSDLHLHLDGSLRLKTLIELARKEKVKLPSYTESGLRKLVFKPKYKDLPEYLQGFQYTCGVLHSQENLERVSQELAEDNIAEGVRYIEVRFAPQLHTSEDLSTADVIRSVLRGLEAAKWEHNRSRAVRKGEDVPFHFGLIVCGMRRFVRGMSPYYADLIRIMCHSRPKDIFTAASEELARAAVELVEREGLPIVGFDLAGEEAGYPPGDHSRAYHYAHMHFIKKTVHAGEAYGPESIFQAITQCYANRIGHGTFLFSQNMIRAPHIRSQADRRRYVENLADYIASQRIGIEVCPTSNLQTTPSIKKISQHPIRKMIDWGLSVSICTDNRLISNTTLSHELQLVTKGLGLTRLQLRNLVVAGFKGSFFYGHNSEKRAYIRQVTDRYAQLEKKLLPPPALKQGMNQGRGARLASLGWTPRFSMLIGSLIVSVLSGQSRKPPPTPLAFQLH